MGGYGSEARVGSVVACWLRPGGAAAQGSRWVRISGPDRPPHGAADADERADGGGGGVGWGGLDWAVVVSGGEG